MRISDWSSDVCSSDLRLAGSDEFRRRFHREAAILARLDSPHVITIFDHAEHDGTPYISTQLIGGGDVGELLRRGGPLPAAVACRIRSAERRVGTECVLPGRSRGWPDT